jgi:hypothetical protein
MEIHFVVTYDVVCLTTCPPAVLFPVLKRYENTTGGQVALMAVQKYQTGIIVGAVVTTGERYMGCFHWCWHHTCIAPGLL